MGSDCDLMMGNPLHSLEICSNSQLSSRLKCVPYLKFKYF